MNTPSMCCIALFTIEKMICIQMLQDFYSILE